VKLLAANELHPAMPQQAFMFMRHNTVGTVAGRNKSPGFLYSMSMERALLPKGDPGLRYTTPESAKSLTLDNVKQYYRKVFRPDMTTIVVVGDVTPDQVRKVVTANFGQWKADGAKPDVNYPAVALNKAGHFHTPDSSAVQDTVTLSQMLKLTENSPDRYAVTLGNQILGGGGFGNRLIHDLRVKGGLVYGVSSGTSLDKHRGRFSITFGCDPDKVSKARTMAIHDVKQMLSQPVSASELHDAKGKVLRQLQLSQSSFSSIGNGLLRLSLAGKPLNSLEIAAHKYYGMSADDIQKAFTKYLRPDGFVTGIKGPKPTK